MPARFRLVLEPKVVHDAGPPRHTGPGLHACLLAAVASIDPVKAAWLHSPQVRPKPFAISPLLERADSGPSRFGFEVGVLLDSLSADVGRALSGLDIVRIGHSSFLPVDLLPLLDESYDTFRARGTVATAWRLRFMTPTTVRTESATGVHLGQPLPTTQLVFNGLAKRWAHFSPTEALPAGLADVLRRHLHVARHEIRTAEYLVAPRRPLLTGFVGDVEFAVLDAKLVDPAVLMAIDTLARFAAVAGVGDQTTKGMGMVVPFEEKGTGSGR